MSQPFLISAKAGVQRDGTLLASEFYSEAVWCRFQRGQPRKMGGYRAMSRLALGPVRSLMVDSRNGINSAHYFSEWGVQRQQFSADGAGGGLENRTPASFVRNDLLTWSHAILSSSTGGNYSALIAAATPDLLDISSDTSGGVYTGSMADAGVLTQLMDGVSPLQVSGGVAVLHPFPVAFGSSGLVKVGNPNDLTSTTWTPGGSSLAIEANVAGTKMLYAAPVRGGGQSPAGLVWSMDSLVRMSFVGGTVLWQFDTISDKSSVLSKKAIVAHDGKFFWPGTDRFLFYNGVVQELPNQMNSNWFFENLNYDNRNKVWGTKIPRFGEIWWFYPRGDSVECNAAVIFNYAEGIWYDAEKMRSAGDSVQTFQYPIWAGSEDKQDTVVLPIGHRLFTSVLATAPTSTLVFVATTGVVDGMAVFGTGVDENTTVVSHTATDVVLSDPITADIAAGSEITFTSMNDPFIPGEIVTGGTSAATGKVVVATLTQLNLIDVTGTFNAAEALTGSFGGEAATEGASYAQQLDAAYQHESGRNKILGQEVIAVPSSFTTRSFGFAVGLPVVQDMDPDTMTVLERLDPDYGQVGALTAEALGRSYTGSEMRVLQALTIEENESFVKFRGAQERELQLRITSNTVDGFYQSGKPLAQLKPGDGRSSVDTQ